MPDAAQTSHWAALQIRRRSTFESGAPMDAVPCHAHAHPTGQGTAASGRYAELRPHLLRTGELISTREAERRAHAHESWSGRAGSRHLHALCGDATHFAR